MNTTAAPRHAPVRAVIPLLTAALLLPACGRRGHGLSAERRIADAMYAVIAADRAVYANEVVDRLQNREAVLRASEHFRSEKKLPLPAQMLRMAAEQMRRGHQHAADDLSYALVSLWPINRQNGPRTETERVGLHAIASGAADVYAAPETLAGRRYLTAVYADRAASAACVACHNAHEQSPRHDFQLGQVMGGVVIRVGVR